MEHFRHSSRILFAGKNQNNNITGDLSYEDYIYIYVLRLCYSNAYLDVHTEVAFISC